MIKRYMSVGVLMLTLLSSSVIFAAQPQAWKIVPEQSKLTFTATQNNAPISGEFKTFTGDIHFDPAQLASSNVRIVVDMTSVDVSYKEALDALKGADWFNVKLFPQAIFKASNFTKTGDNTYQANGTLTIRDKSSPITLTFIIDEYTKTGARAHGSTMLKRAVFGVGQGEWAKTDVVKDDVEVKFTLTGSTK